MAKNKSIELMERMGLISPNFIAEIKGATANNSKMVNLNELNAKSLIEKHSKDGYVIISPCRGYDEFGIDRNQPNANQLLAQANKPRIKELIELIKKSNFSYTPVYGGFIENLGEENEENVYERSFVVYPYDKQGKLHPFEELKAFAVEMCAKYNQDSVLIKEPNSAPKYVNREGETDFELGNNVTFNDFAEEYFTDLHKNTQGKGNGRPTRFTYTECYINPAPCSLNESHIRHELAEKFIPYI